MKRVPKKPRDVKRIPATSSKPHFRHKKMNLEKPKKPEFPPNRVEYEGGCNQSSLFIFTIIGITLGLGLLSWAVLEIFCSCVIK